MLPGNNNRTRASATRRRARATLVAVVGLCLAFSLWWGSHSSAWAQPPGSPARTAMELAPPPADAMKAYRTIAPWIAGWSLPGSPKLDDLPAATGACVLLRLDGEPAGRGSAMTLDSGADSREKVVWQAVVEAFSDADRRSPIERDALRSEKLRALGKRMAVSIELAGPLTPVRPDTFDDLDRMLIPGIDGLAARLGGRIEAFFPSAMLSANLPPSEAYKQLVARLTDQPRLALDEPRRLREQQGIAFFKFRTTQLAQPRAGAEPVFLTRGQRIVPQSDLDSRAELLAFATSMADNLVRRKHAGSERLGMFGTYLPWLGRYEPTIASPAEQALTLCAVMQCDALLDDTRDKQRRAQYREVCTGLLAAISNPPPTQLAPWEDTAASALLVGLADRNDPPLLPALAPALPDLRTRCAKRVLAAEQDAAAQSGAGPLTGLLALAFSQAHALSADRPADAAATRAAVQAAIEHCAATDLPGQMPFLGLALLNAWKDEPQIPAAAGLREMRALLWQNQITGANEQTPPDLAGGVVFSAAQSPLPNWNIARPAALLAPMLADPRLTAPTERPAELVHLLGALRYLRQLQVDESVVWMCRNPDTAMGGIRLAPWDQRMSPDATSMSLLAVCETIRALDRMTAAPQEK